MLRFSGLSIIPSTPCPEIRKMYSRSAKIFHKLVCPELTLMQAQQKFIQEVGYFNWNDFINGGWSDYQRHYMLLFWHKEFQEKRNYKCVNQ